MEDENGKTPMHMAVRFGCEGGIKVLMGKMIIEALIRAEAKVNTEDKNKCTPLHLAAQRGCKVVIETLIGKRADLLLENNDNKIPSDFEKNHYIIRNVKSLWSEERVKRLDQQNKISFVVFGLTILFGAAVATTLFVTETITFGLYSIIGAVVIVVAAAWAGSCATAKILEPNTKVDEMKVDGNERKVLV